MLERLIAMFVGKRVRISHTVEWIGSEEAECTGISVVNKQENRYNLATHNCLYEFVPEVVTNTSTDGPLPAMAGGRRKIEVVH